MTRAAPHLRRPMSTQTGGRVRRPSHGPGSLLEVAVQEFLTRGYDATLVGDAHTTEDLTAYGAPPPDQVIAHTNLYWKYQSAPGRTAGTVETKDVDFRGTP